jgi:hypothetical protein
MVLWLQVPFPRPDIPEQTPPPPPQKKIKNTHPPQKRNLFCQLKKLKYGKVSEITHMKFNHGSSD